MRELTAKQKQKIHTFVEECKNPAWWDEILPNQDPFISPVSKSQTVILTIDDVPTSLWEEIDKLHPTEIYYQNMLNYIPEYTAKMVDEYRRTNHVRN